MHRNWRTVFVTVGAVLALACGHAATPSHFQAQAQTQATQPASAKSFVRDDLASDAIRLEDRLRREAGALADRPAAQLRREADAIAGRDARRALQLLQAAAVAAPRDAAIWRAAARTALAIDARDWSERYRLREFAATAAYLAYQRATTRADEAAGLVILGEASAVRELWRPALNAYRASLALDDSAAVRAIYQDLREKHGFRVLDYKVDSDSAQPRICFKFSEQLAQGRVDFAPFVSVSGLSNAAVSPEGASLCVDGLKHGERYTFLVRQGLPSSLDEALLRSVDYTVYVRDRSPQVRFTGRNYVLPRVGQEGVPIVSINTAKVAVEVMRIGDRSLIPTLRSEDFLGQIGGERARTIAENDGVRVWKGELDARTELNKDVITAFPVIEALGGTVEPGVYVMTAQPAGGPAQDDWTQRATQWFVVSDIGLTALSGPDGVSVIARSLGSAQPLAGVDIRLMARNNEVLATRATDARGMATFEAGLSRGTGGQAPGAIVAQDAKGERGGDYGFLDLGGSPFDLADRGVKGRVAPGPLDAFLFTERGVYRSGETVFLTTLLRDARGAVPASLPLTLIVKRPDGVEFRRVRVEDQGLGGRALSIPLLSGAQRGSWRVMAHADPAAPPIGETTFLVEDYVPERLDVQITPKETVLRLGQPAEVDVLARFLYGAPGSGLEVSGEITVQARADNAIPSLPGFSVGLDDEKVEATTQEIEDKGETDAQGRVSMQIPLPEISAPRPLEAKITLRVGEPGGRAVERSVTLPVLPEGGVIGVRKLFSGVAPEGQPATFEVVAATGAGRRIARSGATWTVYRVERRYQWFNNDGRWGYEPVTSSRRIADGRIDIAADSAARLSVPVEAGSYRLEVRAAESDGGVTSVSFVSGWAGDAIVDTPDLLEMTLDKSAYAAGDEMTLRLSPRFAGTATVMVIGDKVGAPLVVDVPAGGTSVKLPVRAEYGPGAYAVALAHRPLDRAAQRMPGRALGLAWFDVDQGARTLEVAIAAPAQVRPRGKLDLPIRLAGLAAGEEAYVTVSAVDLGILNLTRYQTPKPGEHFFGQRRLATDIRDLYGFLIDGMQGTRGAIRSGGDVAGAKFDGDTPTQEPLARYSGVVRVGADGTATVSFDLPAFNGTVRIAAIAWSKGKVGHAQADVIVRDPVVVAGSLPRFLSLGDQSRFHLEIDNVEGPAGDYIVDVDIRGPVSMPASAARSTVRLAEKARARLTLPITANGVGTAHVDLKLIGPGMEAGQSLVLGVRPATPEIFRRSVRPLAVGASAVLTGDILAEMLPGTGRVSVAASPLSGLDVPALLHALDRYPYGCTEQTVSRAMPLLYVNRLATAERLAIDDGIEGRIREAIDRVLARQDSNGAFGLWSASSGDDAWLDAFVSDFLTRAREANHPVPQRAIDLALDRLRNAVANAGEVDQANGGWLAYSAYVLARNGRPVMGDLRYIADVKLAALPTPLAKAQIAAALALLGDRTRAQTAFAAAVESLRTQRDEGVSRPDYGSRLRDGAGVVALGSEASAPRDLIQRAGLVVTEAREASRYTSTQENAWMILAAQAVAQDGQNIRLTVDGAAHAGPLFRTFRNLGADGAGVTIANAGAAPLQLVVTTSGHPAQPEPALSAGYAVERTFFRLNGTAADMRSVRQTDRFVVVLKITEPQVRFGRVLLVDHLPAGLEIDNPKLVDSGSVAALDWLSREIEPIHVEYRDDRFVAAFDRAAGQKPEFSVAYIVRAVTPGRYVHPPAVIEDMYRPDRFGRTGFGVIEVTPARP